MSIGSIRLITTQKVVKTWSAKGVNQHYLGSNQVFMVSCLSNTNQACNMHKSMSPSKIQQFGFH